MLRGWRSGANRAPVRRATPNTIGMRLNSVEDQQAKRFVGRGGGSDGGSLREDSDGREIGMVSTGSGRAMAKFGGAGGAGRCPKKPAGPWPRHVRANRPMTKRTLAGSAF